MEEENQTPNQEEGQNENGTEYLTEEDLAEMTDFEDYQPRRISLADVKRVLEKVPTEELEDVFISHPYSTEIDEDKLIVVKYDEELAHQFFTTYDLGVIEEFADAIFDDAKKIMSVMMFPEKRDDYAHDFGE